MKRKKRRRSAKFRTLNNSPINFWSDLFIAAMVIFWIVDNVYESLMASAVTISSIILSAQTGTICIDTSMWSSIGTNVAMPLSIGGGIFMIKCAVQHAIFNNQGKEAPYDFPHVDGAELGTNEQQGA